MSQNCMKWRRELDFFFFLVISANSGEWFKIRWALAATAKLCNATVIIMIITISSAVRVVFSRFGW